MNQIYIYIGGIVIAIIICIVLITYLKSYMKKTLYELCDHKEQPTNFWTRFLSVILILIPIIFAMAVIPEDENGSNIFFAIAKQVKWSLIGLAISLIIVGILLVMSVPKKGKNG